MSDPNDKKPTGGLGGPPPGKIGRSLMGWVVLFGLSILIIMLITSAVDKRSELSSDAFWRHAEKGDLVGKITVRPKEILGELSEEVSLEKGEKRKFRVFIREFDNQNLDKDLREAIGKHNTGAYIFHEHASWWESLLPQLLVLAVVFFLVWFFLFRRISAASGGGGFMGNFGRSRHRVLSKEHTSVTFADVAGVEEAKEELKEIIEFLRNPKKFQRLGGRIPRGVLLVGLPGCGKTLMARAIAGEADVPFFSISGSDFVEMFVGVGASRVRDLFKQAKTTAPCIIFLDEIDAVGRRRGQGFNGGGHDEREQTLNAILVEMDGFESSDQVIVIAATNRMDVLDPALTRPGRFDRQVNVPLPDLTGRYDILKIYANKVECGPDIDLQRMARGTPMFSGADLEALVNEAAIAATMAEKDYVEQADMEEARDKVRWGRSRKSHVIDEKEKELTAYHEAGHALSQLQLEDADPLHKVSIIPRGASYGATFSLPEKDRHLYTRRYCEAYIRVCMAGRIAEEIFCGDVDSGAASDIAQATELARRMVMDWGMSDKLGFVRYRQDEHQPMMFERMEYSDSTAEVIDAEIKAIMAAADRDTRDLIKSNSDNVKRVAEALLRYETLSAEEVERIVAGESLDKPTVGDLLSREQSKTDDPPAAGSEPESGEDPQAPPIPEPG